MNFRIFNRSIRVLLLGSAVMQIGAALFAPIYAIFVKDIGGDILDTGIAVGLFSLAAGIVTLFSARIVDKIKNPKAVITAGYLVMGIGYFLYLFVDSIASLFAIQILIGLASAYYTPAYDLVYTSSMPETKIGKMWGGWDAMSRFSVAIGAIFGGIIVTIFSFDTMFIIMSLLCVAGGLYIYFGLENNGKS